MVGPNTPPPPYRRAFHRSQLVTIVDLIATAFVFRFFLDHWVAIGIARLEEPHLFTILRIVPNDTSTFGLLCIFGIMFMMGYRVFSFDNLTASRGIFIFGSAVCALAIADLLKPVFGRTRPGIFLNDGPDVFRFFTVSNDFDSFPSSHAAFAFGLAGAIATIWPESRRLFLSLAAAVAAARVLIERHFISDALVGTAIGLGAAAVLQILFASNNIILGADD